MKENEFVYVYFGRLHAPARPDPAEIASLEFVGLAEIGRRIRQKPSVFTYWMKHYIQNHHRDIARHIRADR
jgi:isopentenyldiphosphate isomerase